MSKVFTITEGLENMGALRTGGQGSVYKGRRMGPIISAVKLLPTPIHTEDEGDKNFRNFQNEVQKLKKVNEDPNPNVVKILNSGLTESGSFPFIEMEFIEGPDLEELLKAPHDSLFTIKEVIKLADHLANALAHCHKVGVKHGDIKSNNVKYNIHSGNYVLLDFGLAIMSDEQRRTSIRHAGAIEFMAPEQNTGAMLFQTDIYSFGIILYELVAGTVPFPLHDSGETSRNTVMVAHMESEVPDILELRQKNMPKTWPKDKRDQEMRVPSWLLNIIEKCLKKEPEERYSNGMELQNALADGSLADHHVPLPQKLVVKDTVTNTPVMPPTAPVIQDDGMMLISKPVFVGLMGLLLLALITAGYLLFNDGRRVKPANTLVKDSISKQNPDTGTVVKPVASYRPKKSEVDSITQKLINDDADQQKQKALENQDKTDSTKTTTDTANTNKQPDNN